MKSISDEEESESSTFEELSDSEDCEGEDSFADSEVALIKENVSNHIGSTKGGDPPNRTPSRKYFLRPLPTFAQRQSGVQCNPSRTMTDDGIEFLGLLNVECTDSSGNDDDGETIGMVNGDEVVRHRLAPVPRKYLVTGGSMVAFSLLLLMVLSNWGYYSTRALPVATDDSLSPLLAPIRPTQTPTDMAPSLAPFTQSIRTDPPTPKTMAIMTKTRDRPSAYENPNDTPFEPPGWIQDYIAFHKSNINAKHHRIKTPLVRFLQWNCRVSKQTRVCGGIADRLKGIAMGLLMSIIDSRVFIIKEWFMENVEHPTMFYLEPNWIDWTGQPSKQYDLEDNRTTYELNTYEWKKNGEKEKRALFFQNPCNYTDDDHIGVRFMANSITKQRFLQNLPCLPGPPDYDGNILRTLFWSLFRFSDRVHAEADRLRGPITARNYYVAAHIRTGIGASWVDHRLFHTDPREWDQFSTCIQAVQRALESHCDGQKPMAYLASDNQDAKDYVQHRTPGLHAADLEIVHIDRSHPEMIINATAAYEAVMGEFKVLMDSTCIVRSKSSGFSDLAAQLSRQDLRCEVEFDKCTPYKVKRAVSGVQCPSFD